jgi:hypothetical protein
VAARIAVWHHDHRHAEGRHLRQGGGAGPADDEVRRRQGVQHALAQERLGPVAAPDVLRQALAGGQGRGVARLPGHLQDLPALDEPGQRRIDREAESLDRL